MGTKETSGGSNPFTRFAFASSRDTSGDGAAVKEEVPVSKPATGLKRSRSEERLEKEDETGTDSKLELLLELFQARETMETPIDKFGTQVCVAPNVSSAKVERFQLLVAALLSSQTQDPITYAAMQRLHERSEDVDGLTIAAVTAINEEELSELLKPVGFYHRKAQQLRRVASILHKQYHDDIPRSLSDLLTLPGIGPKIGRVIVLLAWGQADGIVVDTHVHRLSQRLGWASTTNAEDTRRELEDWIPREHWSRLSLAVVGFGQVICTARHPSCSKCPLAAKCPSAFKVDDTSTTKKKSKTTRK